MIAKTKEMIQISKDISDIGVKYQTIITKMFVGLSNLNSDGKWSGDSANEFVEAVLKDKDSFEKVGDRIKEFANTILNHANSIESNVSKVLEDENNG